MKTPKRPNPEFSAGERAARASTQRRNAVVLQFRQLVPRPGGDRGHALGRRRKLDHLRPAMHARRYRVHRGTPARARQRRGDGQRVRLPRGVPRGVR